MTTLVAPNLYVVLSEGDCHLKISRLLKAYPSHAGFSEHVLMALMRLPGAGCGVTDMLAEAFCSHRIVSR